MWSSWFGGRLGAHWRGGPGSRRLVGHHNRDFRCRKCVATLEVSNQLDSRRLIWAEMNGVEPDLKHLGKTTTKIPVILVTNATTVCDAKLAQESAALGVWDRREDIEALHVRELLDNVIVWCSILLGTVSASSLNSGSESSTTYSPWGGEWPPCRTITEHIRIDSVWHL